MIRDLILRWARAREPHFVIGGRERPYLRRWWLTPWSRCYRSIPDAEKTLWQQFVTRLPGIYVHQFLRSDDDRALHGHPWIFNASFILEGSYWEHSPDPQAARAYGVEWAASNVRPVKVLRREGAWKFRWGCAPHRVELQVEMLHGTIALIEPCWTLFITGPRIADWGFYCPRGFVPWEQFTAADDPGAIGRGCGP